MNKVGSVDDYIKSAPKEVQAKLKKLRETIKSVVPDATEKISYGMPYYGYKGRLAYFAYFKNHIGFYAMHGALEDYKAEVKEYQTGRATLRFDLDKELPLDLVQKLIKATAKKIDGD